MDVWVCILEADGGELAAALTAGAAAIADAGIPMTDLVSAVSLVSFWQTQAFWSHTAACLQHLCRLACRTGLMRGMCLTKMCLTRMCLTSERDPLSPANHSTRLPLCPCIF